MKSRPFHASQYSAVGRSALGARNPQGPTSGLTLADRGIVGFSTPGSRRHGAAAGATADACRRFPGGFLRLHGRVWR